MHKCCLRLHASSAGFEGARLHASSAVHEYMHQVKSMRLMHQVLSMRLHASSAVYETTCTKCCL